MKLFRLWPNWKSSQPPNLFFWTAELSSLFIVSTICFILWFATLKFALKIASNSVYIALGVFLFIIFTLLSWYVFHIIAVVRSSKLALSNWGKLLPKIYVGILILIGCIFCFRTGKNIYQRYSNLTAPQSIHASANEARLGLAILSIAQDSAIQSTGKPIIDINKIPMDEKFQNTAFAFVNCSNTKAISFKIPADWTNSQKDKMNEIFPRFKSDSACKKYKASYIFVAIDIEKNALFSIDNSKMLREEN